MLIVRSRCGRVVGAALAVAVLLACSSSDDGLAGSIASEPDDAPVGVRGPLCPELPSGDSPGNPDELASEPADVALQWIPVGTIFEAGVRATGLDTRLNGADDITVLVPTDDAFAAAFSESTLDELLLSRRDELRDLLESHVIDGLYTADELLQAQTVRTIGGDTVTVTSAPEAMVRLADRADTLCADYRARNARLHVISDVLGRHPAPAATEEPHVG